MNKMFYNKIFTDIWTLTTKKKKKIDSFAGKDSRDNIYSENLKMESQIITFLVSRKQGWW